MKYIFLMPVFVLFLFSCEQEIDLDHLRPKSKLVLNCVPVVGEPVAAYLSRTWFYSDGKDNKMIENADIRLYVNDVFQEKMIFSKDTTGTFRPCFRSKYVVQAGDRMKIVASAPDFKDIEATAELPLQPLISEVTMTHRQLGYYWQCDVGFRFTLQDKPSEENYYLLSFQKAIDCRLTENGDTVYRWSGMPMDFSKEPLLANQILAIDRVFGYDGNGYSDGMAFSDELIDGKSYTFHITGTIYNFGFQPDHPDVPEFWQNDYHRFRVYLFSISRSYYNYLKTLQSFRDNSFTGDLAEIGLAEPVQIYSNVVGGTGILGGAASRMQEFELK